MDNRSVARLTVQKVSPAQVETFEDQLAVEEPLEIRVSYLSERQPQSKTISVTMRTPGNDAELAAGFLFTEGIISRREQVAGADHLLYDEHIVVVKLSDDTTPQLQQAERNFYTTSSCGVCGKSSIDAIKTVSTFQDIKDDLVVDAGKLYGLQDILRKQQAIFESTGGLHASALFDAAGNFMLLREDVGRHNALDKVIGAALLNNELPLNKSILLLSGRASFELIQKATMAGIRLVVAVGAPSSLAVQLANECGITLIGFLRNERFNIYTHSHRITILQPEKTLL
jgi:FdhD protein